MHSNHFPASPASSSLLPRESVGGSEELRPLRRIRDFLAGAVREGAYAPGTRLPTERELAAMFNASRAVARRALTELVEDGLVERHVGRGSFVAQPRLPETSPLALEQGSVSPAEYIQARLCFEPDLAHLVVVGANAADFAAMDEQIRLGAAASSREEFELADAAFHQCIVRATHNKLVIAMYELLHTVRHEQGMWFQLRQASDVADQRHVFQAEHVQIRDALFARDAESARHHLAQHIRATRRRILDL